MHWNVVRMTTGKIRSLSELPVSANTPSPDMRMRPCPICSKMAVKEFHPFCSKRCTDVDLNRWLNGVYAIPVPDDEEDDEGPD